MKPRHGAWHPYYNLRNLLVLTAIHTPLSPNRTARTFLGRVVARLLALDYYEASLLCEAVEDFCHGPRILEDDPRLIHQRLLALKRVICPPCPRGGLHPLIPAPVPRSRLGRLWRLLRSLVRHALKASPAGDRAPAGLVSEHAADRWGLAGADVVAVDNWYADRHVVLRRSREGFRRLLIRAVRVALLLRNDYATVSAAWREAVPRLAGGEFWRAYLGLAAPVDGTRAEEPRRVA